MTTPYRPDLGWEISQESIRSLNYALDDNAEAALPIARAFDIDEAIDRSSDEIDPLDRELMRVFENHPDTRRDALLDVEPSMRDPWIHPVARHVLRACHLDAVDLAALSLWSGELIDIHLPGDLEVMIGFSREHRRLDMGLRVSGARVLWDHENQGESSTMYLKTGVPATVMASLVSRPLGDVVKHPLFDPLDLVIVNAGIFSGGQARLSLAGALK